MDRMISIGRLLAKVLFALALLWITLIIFMPKKSLWYEAEALLLKRSVVFHDESLQSRMFGLDISQAQLYLGPIYAARIASIDLTILGIYNRMVLHDLFVGTELQTLKGLHIKEAVLRYWPWGDVSVEAKGNFGTLAGFVDLEKHRVELDVMPTKWLKGQPLIMSRLKKRAKGYHFAWNY